MSRRQSKVEVGHQHAQLLKGIQVWLEQHPDTTPLELGVFGEIVGRVENHAKHGSLVRVRIKNQGSKLSPSLHGNAMRMLTERKQRERWEGRNWTLEECDRLEVLYCRERKPTEEIAEMLERGILSVKDKVVNLGLHRRRVNPSGFTKPTAYKTNSALEAARRVKERRMQAMAMEREEESVAD